MGTRGMMGFILKDGSLKGSYNHFDSYPTYLGANLQEDLRDWFKKYGADGWEALATAVDEIRWVSEDAEPTEEDREKFGHLAENVSTGKDWYALIRALQGKLADTLSAGVSLEGGEKFLRNSLFCEWAYLIDFSKRQVVILKGFNRSPLRQAPYCAWSDEEIAAEIPEHERIHGDRRPYLGCTEIWRGSMPEFLDIDMRDFEKKLAAISEACDEEASDPIDMDQVTPETFIAAMRSRDPVRTMRVALTPAS